MERKYDSSSEFTLDEIARILGLSRERVRQIERAALKKLKHPSVSKKLREYMNN
jgi:RNA polymerase primary sigma factor